MAHDEKNEAQEGDKVMIGETRPLSARKHHTLLKVVEKAGVKHIEEETPVAKAKKAEEADKAGEEKA
jgi:hypothetical protein